MIEQLLPGAVAAAWTTHDAAKADLFPEEEACLRHAVALRRREFTTGRLCARRALARLDLPAQVVPAGDRGEPLWPAGIVGAITHCPGYRAAAVARYRDVRSLGIDAEEHRPLPAELLGPVLLPDEREHAEALRRAVPGIHWETVIFSAKESVYKAWFPLAKRWLGFHDARLRVNPRGSFAARLLVPGPMVDGIAVNEFRGRWRCAGSVIVTALAHSARYSGDERGSPSGSPVRPAAKDPLKSSGGGN